MSLNPALFIFFVRPVIVQFFRNAIIFTNVKFQNNPDDRDQNFSDYLHSKFFSRARMKKVKQTPSMPVARPWPQHRQGGAPKLRYLRTENACASTETPGEKWSFLHFSRALVCFMSDRPTNAASYPYHSST